MFRDGAVNGLWWNFCIVLLEKGIYSFVMRQVLKEMVSRLCVTSWCELWSQKEMGPLISIALMHTWTLTSCNGATWINMGFFTHQYLLFWKLCPLRYNQVSLLNWMSVGLISPFGRYQFTKFSFLWRLWMTVVLCGWKCSIFVAFLVVPLTQLFAMSVAPEIFLDLLQCSTRFLYFYLISSVPFCMFCYCLKWNLFLETYPVVWIDFWSLIVSVLTELSWLLKREWEREY